MPDKSTRTASGRLEIISETDVQELADNARAFLGQAVQYQELMMMYDCAIKEIQTKLEVLNAELSVRYQRNPIEFINCRIKKPVSIVKKLQKMNLPPTVETLQSNALNDIAGIRVVCSFIDDIYAIAGMLTRQDDVTLIRQKDYIQNPKPNGYRSLHLILEVPVFFSDQTRPMRVEVQIRTIAMDFWASLDHQLRYKKDVENEPELVEELRDCAEIIAATDERMLRIKDKIYGKDMQPLQQDANMISRLKNFALPKK